MIVLGLGYGDEGKGLTTSYLCSKTENPIVVRFNGGQQAGHTVVYNGKRHVFSSFGSGSLQGVPTYWSQFCTFYPPSFLREYELLDNPKIYVHPLCHITTPFDVERNKYLEVSNKHGSVGMGFGATLERSEKYYKLFVQDLFFPDILEAKLKSIAKYYNDLIGVYPAANLEVEEFMKCAEEVTKIINIKPIEKKYTPIFEGAQGILLDMDFGFFPHVTRSNTTSKNALSIAKSEEVYYVTRSYLTRHGNGPLLGESKLHLLNNENETNKSHMYQGEFRTAPLNTELINYALLCDSYFSHGLKKNLVITCLDQYSISIDSLLDNIDTEFDKVFISNGDSLTNITQYK